MPEILLQNTLRCLVDVVNSETSALAAVAMQALGHIGLRITLPPIDDSNSGKLKSNMLTNFLFGFGPRIELFVELLIMVSD